MKSKNAEKSVETQAPAANATAARKRFRIEKLEERIAPKQKGTGGQTSSGLSWGSPSIY